MANKITKGFGKITGLFDQWFSDGYLKIAVWVLVISIVFGVFLVAFNLLFKVIYGT